MVLSHALGFVILLVLKANGDDDAKTILRRDDSDVWVEIHPDLSEKNTMHRELHKRFHPHAGNQREEAMDRQWETRRRVRAHGNGNRDGERDSVSGVSNE